jgi:hypothetical protein
MKLARDINFGDRTANENVVDENVHTSPTYDFSTYCESKEKEKSKKYFDEHFNLEEAFGELSECCDCSGTGWIPVSQSNMKEPLHSLWKQAEINSHAEDGFQLVPCPKCSPVSDGLSEHIVKVGSEFELKSKKSGKNLGKYKSKKGALKREKQVEYFKNMKEESIVEDEAGALKGTENGKPLPWRLHEQEVLPGNPSKLNEELPSEHNKKQSQAKKDEKKNPNAEKTNLSPDDKKRKDQEKRKEKENDRKSKKLLPYEFTDQKDAERAAGHLGLHGSHGTGNGIYKPGSSDYALRDAVSRKKAKQKQRGGVNEDAKFDSGKSAINVDSHDAYPLEKSNCHEDRDYMHSEDPKTDGNKMAESVVQKIKECVIFHKH